MTVGLFNTMFAKFNKKNKWLYENGYFLTSDTQRYLKTFFHNELFVKSIKIKGDIFEFGVFKGNSLIRFATLASYFNPKKKIYGFDIFGKFPIQQREKDNKFIKKFEKNSGYGLEKKSLIKYMKQKKLNNFELINGDICKTLPIFLNKHNPKISLLHIDVDVYLPTKIILEKLFDRVTKGGIIIFDDYGVIEGETLAVDEFFEKRKLKKNFLTYKNFKSPVFYIKK